MLYHELFEAQRSSVTGIYVAAHYTDETADRLREFQDSLDIPNPSDPDDFHTTIVYSKRRIHWRCEHDCHWPVTPKGWAVWKDRDGKKSTLVMLVESPYLRTRFKLAMDRGASYDFPDYNPHISFSYDVPHDFDTSKLPLPQFDMIVGCERAKELYD